MSGFSSEKTTLALEFAAAMARFGPFGARALFGVGVSGGADSTALALLAQSWVAERGGAVLALIVDHGLRGASATEAELTRQRLEARGIAAQVITLSGLAGANLQPNLQPNLQQRARLARHAALGTATRKAGALYLLLGHHAADQSETVAMRAARGNGGLEGIAGWTARNDAVVLRPLLTVAPGRLREFLRLENMHWVEDPSNQDRRFERVRVRLAGTSAVPRNPAARQRLEVEAAEFLARHCIIRPEGFAVILADSAPALALAALLRTIAGAQYAPRRDAVQKLAEKLQPATLGGVRVLKAGRLGTGWLLVREAQPCATPIPAAFGSIWDNRFCILEASENGLCGAAGADAPLFRNASNLPEAVLAGLPCTRTPSQSGIKAHLTKVFFTPPAPAASLPFLAPG